MPEEMLAYLYDEYYDEYDDDDLHFGSFNAPFSDDSSFEEGGMS